MTSPSPDTGLVERLRTDADKGSKEIATFERVSAKHASQLIANSLEAASRIEALTAQQQEPVREVGDLAGRLLKTAMLLEIEAGNGTFPRPHPVADLARESAARISTLEAQLVEAREALRDIANGRGVCSTCGTPASDDEDGGYTTCACKYPVWVPVDPRERARAALNKDETGGAG